MDNREDIDATDLLSDFRRAATAGRGAGKRSWMDQSPEAFAYRCLPLNIANAHGWEILARAASSPMGWRRERRMRSSSARRRMASALPPSHFGFGVLTFRVHGSFAPRRG